ncbi:hypothetical protein Q4599_14990 [Cellulophaga lytica]|uniref:hypothetical protein n=1 Tax=Cellulophaga lytica TaxID=979 RepID=UPI0026E2D902|nr:hypothetical protein [Cellulophaga lytica]MDO6854896.1 hypothetical protein [Cellulophaga lytica]
MPNNLKKISLGVSVVIFMIFTFVIGPTNVFGLEKYLQNNTNYFFGVSTYYLDYALLAFIPFFGIFLNYKRNSLNYFWLLIHIAILLFSAILSFIIGLYILTFIGKPTNPLVPKYIVTEPIFLYSTICIGIGILIPFILVKAKK